MMFARSHLLWLVLPALFLLGHPSHAVSFSGLGDLAGGTFQSQAFGVSGDGSTVVGASSSVPNGRQAFVWTDITGMIGIESGLFGGDVDSQALDVSTDGSTVVGRDNPAPIPDFIDFPEQGFRWENGASLPFPSTLPSKIGFDCAAFGVSDDGLTVVGWARGPNGKEAFRMTFDELGFGTMVSLGGAPVSAAYDASADGSVIVGQSGGQAFVWTSIGGITPIAANTALSVTPDGSVVVGFTGSEAFRWTSSGGVVGLGTLEGGSVTSLATAVSADGATVVGHATSGPGATEAFIWDATNGMRSLQTVLVDSSVNLTGWTLRSAQGISDDGNVIVGYGINPSGNTEAWLVDFLPEPSTPLLQGIALLVLAGLHARHKRG